MFAELMPIAREAVVLIGSIRVIARYHQFFIIAIGPPTILLQNLSDCLLIE
jgi:hypothetical protein